jgi:adenosine deaminase
MLALLFAAGCAVVPTADSDPVAAIRNNRAMLQYFFSQMPKGGDLHNHLTGSAYAETYFDIAVNARMYLDTQTFKLYKEISEVPPQHHAIQLRPDMPDLHGVRIKCIEAWSIRDYEHLARTLPPDEFFFNTFGIFGNAASGIPNHTTLLRELRQRAAHENVSYLEIMLTSPTIKASMNKDAELVERLKAGIRDRDSETFQSLLREIQDTWERDASIQQDIDGYARMIGQVHNDAANVAPGVVSRYQTYCSRNSDPLTVFAQLYIGFKASERSPLLVGVNIVAPENGEVALRDYWGHMEMFKHFKSLYPSVKTAMHAGELRLGLTPPEDMNFHITDAVFQAGADRIGHGVDIAFETNAQKTLKEMASKKIAVEINLTSNEFILGVKGSEHPLMLYLANNVPIVLSTDDPGILRSNLTEQYVLAAERYSELKYPDFQEFARNSIVYSFLPEEEKEHLLANLDKRFQEFESKMNMGKRP